MSRDAMNHEQRLTELLASRPAVRAARAELQAARGDLLVDLRRWRRRIALLEGAIALGRLALGLRRGRGRADALEGLLRLFLRP